MTRTPLTRWILAVPALVATAALAACGSDDTATSGDSPSGTGGATCSYTKSGTAAKPVDLPPSQAAETGDVPVTLHTSVGDLKLTLDGADAPCTVNSFISLAQQGYYDGTSCHRLGDTAGFQLLQCGDPTGTGSGGPGYSYDDELSGSETYPAGTLAMANAGPNTNGSQFFMVFGDTNLPASYTVFGTLDGDAIQKLVKVGKAGNDGAWGDGTGRPKTPVTFDSVDIG
jgi:peptidyl-prolyl cis-trans isomerase B (cyclophilin B)